MFGIGIGNPDTARDPAAGEQEVVGKCLRAKMMRIFVVWHSLSLCI